MPIPLLLLPVLQNHGHAKHQNGINADNAKSRGENLIEVLVCESRELADAAALLRGDERVETGAVLDKGRGGGVEVAAAVELDGGVAC